MNPLAYFQGQTLRLITHSATTPKSTNITEVKAEPHLLWDSLTPLLLDHASGQDSPASPFAHLRRDKLTSIRLGSPCFMTHQSRGTLTHPSWHHHTATAPPQASPLLCGRSKVCRGTSRDNSRLCSTTAASFLPPPPSEATQATARQVTVNS